MHTAYEYCWTATFAKFYGRGGGKGEESTFSMVILDNNFLSTTEKGQQLLNYLNLLFYCSWPRT